MDENPEITCGGIASIISGGMFVKAAVGLSKLGPAVSFSMWVGVPTSILVSGAVCGTWVWSYDECIRLRNKNLDS